MMRSVAFIIFTIAVVALLLKLGWWQMSRANEKQQLQSQVTTRQQTMLGPGGPGTPGRGGGSR